MMLLGGLSDARAHVVGGQAQVEAPASETLTADPRTGDILVEEQGVASWYGRSWRGRRSASGTRFDDRAMTAAHLWLPFATRARVMNLENGRTVEVVVNDRGPYREGRIIDLSAKAAEALGIKPNGIAEVVVSAQL